MIAQPMDVLTQFPVRKSKKQKQVFRDQVQKYIAAQGYAVRVEKGRFGSHNVIIGDPSNAKYLVTAHYDTCARLPFPNLITPENLFLYLLYQLVLIGLMVLVMATVAASVQLLFHNSVVSFWSSYAGLLGLLLLMIVGPSNKTNANDNTSGVITLLETAATMPVNQRDKVCFVLFDLEEAGLIGSSSYYKAHKKECAHQIVLNLDCVGDGDVIRFYPTKRLRKDENKMKILRKCCGTFGKKTVSIREKGFSVYPSDQASFPCGVGICALRQTKAGLYLGRIHTGRDTILEQTNVNILRAAITSAISCSAVE